MQEAILKIKVDLGPDAVILHQRKVKAAGFMRMLAKDRVEVLAAIDPNEGKGSREEKPRKQPAQPERPAARPSANPDAWREAAAENWAGGNGGVTWEHSGARRPDNIDLGPLAPPAASAPQQSPAAFAAELLARH